MFSFSIQQQLFFKGSMADQQQEISISQVMNHHPSIYLCEKLVMMDDLDDCIQSLALRGSMYDKQSFQDKHKNFLINLPGLRFALKSTVGLCE